jgi:GT2 family glycosyltransferase
MRPNPRVSVITLNWNKWEDTIECLESLCDVAYQNCDVVVVDNGSEEGSLEKLKEYCADKTRARPRYSAASGDKGQIKITEFTRPQADSAADRNLGEYREAGHSRDITLIENERNYGFAEGNNIAIRFLLRSSPPDYILLLNNDTTVESGFLTELVAAAESDERVGIAGAKTYYYDFNGSRNVINSAGGRFNVWIGKPTHVGINKIDNGQYDKARVVDYVEGSCLLIKRETIEDIGLLNPYLFGWEDVDWCLKARDHGWRCVYAPNAKIWHKVGASLGGTFGYTHLYYLTRSSLIFIHQHTRWYHRITLLPIWLATVIRRVVSISSNEKTPRSLLTCCQVILNAYSDAQAILKDRPVATRDFQSF